MGTLKEVNKTLDETIIHHLTLIQEYCNLTGELGTIMSQGFVQIAKSRMVLGQTSLSLSTCDSSEESTQQALITVKSTSEEEHTDHSPVSLCSSMTENDQKKYLAIVRQRMGGFMSPGALQTAQENFSKALVRIVELINIQKELNQGIATYEALTTTKSELLVTDSEQ